jgi:hypothetical protein
VRPGPGCSRSVRYAIREDSIRITWRDERELLDLEDEENADEG